MKTAPQLVDLPPHIFLIYEDKCDTKLALTIFDGNIVGFKIFKGETIHKVGANYVKIGRDVIRLKDCVMRRLPLSVWKIDPATVW